MARLALPFGVAAVIRGKERFGPKGLALPFCPYKGGYPMTPRDIVLCQPVRTAIGAYNGALKGTPAPDLGAVVVRETLKRAGLDPSEIGTVVMGNVVQAGNKMNPARQASVKGGVPVEVPALTVNRV